MATPGRVENDRVTVRIPGPNDSQMAEVFRYASVSRRGSFRLPSVDLSGFTPSAILESLGRYDRRDLLVHFGLPGVIALASVFGVGTLLNRFGISYLKGRGRVNQPAPAAPNPVAAEAAVTPAAESVLNAHIQKILERTDTETEAVGRSWQIATTTEPFDLSMKAPKGLFIREIPSQLGWFVQNIKDGKKDPENPYKTLKNEGEIYLGTHQTFVIERDQSGKVLAVWTPRLADKPLADDSQEFFGVHDSAEPQQLVSFRIRLNNDAPEPSIQQVTLEYFLKKLGIPLVFKNNTAVESQPQPVPVVTK